MFKTENHAYTDLFRESVARYRNHPVYDVSVYLRIRPIHFVVLIFPRPSLKSPVVYVVGLLFTRHVDGPVHV